MSREHRILPRPRSRTLHPLHRSETLAALLFLGLFGVFSLLLLTSRLSPAKLTGHAQNVSTTVNVSPSPPFVCNHTLQQGTNLASFPCLPYQIDRQDFFENISGNGSAVAAMYRYTPWSAGQWQVYNGSLPNYTVQSLASFGRDDGIYFVMDAPETVVYSGYLPNSSTLPLLSGWNLVGYPSATTKPIDESLATINDTYIVVRTLEGTEESGSYLEDTPPPGGETLTNTSIYHGYWMRLSTADNWVVSG